MDTLIPLLLIVVAVIVGLVALYLVCGLIYWLYRIICYNFYFDNPRKVDGKVVDMKYEPSQTYTTTDGNNVTSTHYTPEKNRVIFKTKVKTSDIDSDKLYQRCRIGDDLVVHYQDRYSEPRFWSGPIQMDGHRLIKIECPKDETVLFNDVKPTTLVAARARRGR